MPLAWTPTLEDAVRYLAGWVRAGDLVFTVGAGDVEKVGPMLLEALS
jgi:UDP-N-acetylmuramate-alanine ligase